MEILQWAFPYFPTLGGREIFIDRLVVDFHNRGHEVFILSNESDENSPFFESIPGEFPHERINLAALKNSEDPMRFNKYRDFAVECIKKWQPDIIHIHNIYEAFVTKAKADIIVQCYHLSISSRL